MRVGFLCAKRHGRLHMSRLIAPAQNMRGTAQRSSAGRNRGACTARKTEQGVYTHQRRLGPHPMARIVRRYTHTRPSVHTRTTSPHHSTGTIRTDDSQLLHTHTKKVYNLYHSVLNTRQAQQRTRRSVLVRHSSAHPFSRSNNQQGGRPRRRLRAYLCVRVQSSPAGAQVTRPCKSQ